jgi:FkbM family methyltransferase
MASLAWRFSCFVSRWRNRFRYLVRAPFVYRNWWALPLPKLGISVVLTLRNGLQYLVRAGTTDLSVVNEAALLNPYLGGHPVDLPEDADVMDVGANIGDLTMQLARACPRGRVFAIEPVGEHHHMIAVQMLLNRVSHVVNLQVALGGQEGEVAIHLGGSHSSSRWGQGATEKVRLTTLPQMMRELGIHQLALLKLDCEGAEWDILPAAEEVLPRVQRIFMEFHCERGWTPEKLAAWLRERGYEVRHTAGPWNGLLWATRKEAQPS